MGNRRAPRAPKNAHPKRVWMGDGLGWEGMGESGGRDDADVSVSARGMRHVEQYHAVSVTLAEIACVVGIDFGDHQKKGQRTSFRSIFRARPPTLWLEGHPVAMMATRRVCAVPSTTAATSRNYILDNNNAAGGSRYAVGPPRPASRTAPTPSLDLLQPLQRQRRRPCSKRSDS